MERGFSFSPEEFYHIYSRGVDRRVIFNDNKDKQHFLKLLYLCNSSERIEMRNLPHGKSVYEYKKDDALVDIGAYCLMPNHIHLLLHEHAEGGITKFMAKLLTAYLKYFNKKVNRTGALFDGRLRARNVTDDSYMHYLYSYIHLNPIKLLEPKWRDRGIKNIKEAKDFLEKYYSSSYLDFLGQKRLEEGILSRASFPEYFSDKADFGKFIDEWLRYREDY